MDSPSYSINDLSNTPLWNLIQKKINDQNLEWENGTVDDEVGSNSRKSNICWICEDDFRKTLFSAVNDHNRFYWNYDLDLLEPLQYGIYPEGGYYNWHIDSWQESININNKPHNRKLSFTIFLNDPDEYDGGELDIEVDGPQKDLRYHTFKRSMGTIILFKSSSWHRVRPVTSGIRKSLVGWVLGPPFR